MCTYIYSGFMCQLKLYYLGKPQKKVLLLIAGPIRLNSPLELNGRWNVGKLKKKVPQKFVFP